MVTTRLGAALVALLAPLLLVAAASPSTAAPKASSARAGAEAADAPAPMKARKKCRDAGTSTTGIRTKHCWGWGRAGRGVSLTSPNSFHDKYARNGQTESLQLNFKLADTRADGRCALVRVVKNGYHPYRQYLEDYVCGRGESTVSTYEFTHQVLRLAPGKFYLQLCSSPMPGGNVTDPKCRTIFTQTFR